MEKILRDFIERGWLEPCHSEWASPCFVVPKKVAGECRLVVDYRGLNAQTQHDSYTLPLIDNMLQKLHRRRIFTVIDLKHGYHQMPLARGVPCLHSHGHPTWTYPVEGDAHGRYQRQCGFSADAGAPA